MIPCMLVLYYAISSINSEFSIQVTPYQSHHDTVNLSQLLLSIHSSPDARENEGLKDGITDIEGSLGKDTDCFLG